MVAKVDGEDVTSEEVRETARGMLQQQGAQFGANASILLPFFAQRAADQLIDRQALVSEAQHLGFKATPQEIRDELQHGRYAEIFFPAGISSARPNMRTCCSSTISLPPCSKTPWAKRS